ncbi:hypothetical protein SDC9_120015 [bioreactor metagenome]|uniref:Uncharacterized protein n=1 Tax=bioreactor metagenome TaxID=1076179 RepID=A0A645C5X4_9ZZZZ
MVVGDLQVLHKPIFIHTEPLVQIAIDHWSEWGAQEGLETLGQRRNDIGGDIPAVGAGIGYDLMLFIERLQGIQGLLGTEIEEVVRITLQFGEVICQGGLFTPFCSLNTDNLAFLAYQKCFKTRGLILTCDAN